MASRKIRQLFESLALTEGGAVMIRDRCQDSETNYGLAQRVTELTKSIYSLYPSNKYCFGMSPKEYDSFDLRASKLEEFILAGQDKKTIAGCFLTSLGLALIEDRLKEVIAINPATKIIGLLEELTKAISDLHKAIDEDIDGDDRFERATCIYNFWVSMEDYE